MNWDLLNKKIAAYHFGEIQVKTVVGILILSGILIGFFFLFRRYVVPYLGSRRTIRRVKVGLYRTEVFVWTVFFIFSLYQLLSDSIYITSALLIVIAFVGWNFWRDLFIGIAFRIENKFQLRDPVRFDNYLGTLEEISTRNIRIKTEKEELVTIPFRKLSDAIFIKRQAKGKLHSKQLTLNCHGMSAEEFVPQINAWLFECPWAVVNEEAVVNIIGPGLVQLTVYGIDKESIKKIEEYLQFHLRK